MSGIPTYRTPLWWIIAPAFVFVGLLLIVASLWAGTPILTVVGTAFWIWILESFAYRTLFRVDLADRAIRGRSLLRAWVIPISEIEHITPGWTKPWWRSNSNHYVVTRAHGLRLFIWCGKGLAELLSYVGKAEPRLAQRPEDGVSRTERSRSPNGFSLVEETRTA